MSKLSLLEILSTSSHVGPFVRLCLELLQVDKKNGSWDNFTLLHSMS